MHINAVCAQVLRADFTPLESIHNQSDVFLHILYREWCTCRYQIYE